MQQVVNEQAFQALLWTQRRGTTEYEVIHVNWVCKDLFRENIKHTLTLLISHLICPLRERIIFPTLLILLQQPGARLYLLVHLARVNKYTLNRVYD